MQSSRVGKYSYMITQEPNHLICLLCHYVLYRAFLARTTVILDDLKHQIQYVKGCSFPDRSFSRGLKQRMDRLLSLVSRKRASIESIIHHKVSKLPSRPLIPLLPPATYSNYPTVSPSAAPPTLPPVQPRPRI